MRPPPCLPDPSAHSLTVAASGPWAQYLSPSPHPSRKAPAQILTLYQLYLLQEKAKESEGAPQSLVLPPRPTPPELAPTLLLRMKLAAQALGAGQSWAPHLSLREPSDPSPPWCPVPAQAGSAWGQEAAGFLRRDGELLSVLRQSGGCAEWERKRVLMRGGRAGDGDGPVWGSPSAH